MIVKFNPAGRVMMVFGRRKESVDEDSKPWQRDRNPPLPRDRRAVPRADRRRVGFHGQHLHHGRLHQLARREVRQERQLGDVVGRARHRAGPVQSAARHRDRQPRQHLRGRSHEPSHSGVRHRRKIPADVHDRRAAGSGDPRRLRQHADRRGACRRQRPAELDLHHAGSESGDVRRREHVPGADLQGLARRPGARRHRPIRTSAEAVLRRARARVSVGPRDLRRGDRELARAEGHAASAAATRPRPRRPARHQLDWHPRRAPENAAGVRAHVRTQGGRRLGHDRGAQARARRPAGRSTSRFSRPPRSTI